MDGDFGVRLWRSTMLATQVCQNLPIKKPYNNFTSDHRHINHFLSAKFSTFAVLNFHWNF